jgi:Tol biopolymer transport system component
MRTAAATLVAVVAIATVATPAAATFPGSNGRITFMREDADGIPQVWTANPDLTHQVQVTAARGGFSPAWSPDGRRIAFQRNTDPDPSDGQEIQDIFTMRADGTDVRQITPSIGDSEKPAWSPDGRWLVFSADAGNYPDGQGIYLIPSDGSGPMRMLTPKPDGTFFAELPRLSPDGSQVVFTAYRGANFVQNPRQEKLAGFESALFVVRIDATGIHQLTPWGTNALDPDWSPDGTRIVFAGQPPHLGNVGDVLVVDADGRHLQELTHDHGATGFSRSDQSPWYEESFNAVWSPDGTKILFVHASYRPETGFALGLQSMNADGSGRAWVSDGHGFEHQPDWGSAPLIP